MLCFPSHALKTIDFLKNPENIVSSSALATSPSTPHVQNHRLKASRSKPAFNTLLKTHYFLNLTFKTSLSSPCFQNLASNTSLSRPHFPTSLPKPHIQKLSCNRCFQNLTFTTSPSTPWVQQSFKHVRSKPSFQHPAFKIEMLMDGDRTADSGRTGGGRWTNSMPLVNVN